MTLDGENNENGANHTNCMGEIFESFQGEN
jgi:hypothetical protein